MSKMLILTAAIWLTGASSTAALVTTLSQPPAPVLNQEEELRTEIPRKATLIGSSVNADPSDSFAVPTAYKSPPRQMGFSRTPKPKEMRCGEMKSLQQGSVDQGVRICTFQ